MKVEASKLSKEETPGAKWGRQKPTQLGRNGNAPGRMAALFTT